MSNIILVNPPPKQIVEEYDQPEYPHIGIGYLASSLESHGFSPAVIDAKLEHLNLDSTIERILSTSPELVGITAMTHEITFAHDLATHLKNAGCDATIVIGGVHVTALPERTLRDFPSFDIGVIGEGEYTFVEISEYILIKKKMPSGIPGTVYREEGSAIRLAPERPSITDLDSLHLPAWHLFPRATQYPILTARGCPARCIFCAHSYGYKLRERSPENVIQEWKMVLNTYSPKIMRMLDETFGLNKKRAMKILDMVIEQGLTIPWFGYTRANIVTLDLMRKMKESGCFKVGIGVESGDPDILKAIRKGITIEQAEQAFKYIHKAGIESHAFFILGFPNETYRTIWRTIRFAARLKATHLALGIMVPYPQTEIARMAEKGEGGYRIISRDWNDYNKQIGNALELKNISRRQLEIFQFIGYVYFYLARGRIIEFLRFAWSFRSEAWGFLRHFLCFQRKAEKA